MRIYFFISTLLICLPITALARPIGADKQAHFIVGFQSVFMLERFLQRQDVEPNSAVFAANAMVLAAALAKEQFIDSSFSGGDLAMGFGGALIASILFKELPENSYELEAEGGYFHILHDKLRPESPPQANIIKAQTTFWPEEYLGIHIFSGGEGNTSKSNDRKRILFGGGLRLSLFPAYKPAPLWLGIDYGRLVFGTSDRVTPYRQSKSTFFYSAGASVKIHRSLFISGEGQFIPYGAAKLWSLGGSLGVRF